MKLKAISFADGVIAAASLAGKLMSIGLALKSVLIEFLSTLNTRVNIASEVATRF